VFEGGHALEGPGGGHQIGRVQGFMPLRGHAVWGAIR
jgi:hypothetical protein